MDQVIHSAIFEKSSSKLSECTSTNIPEYAFIGRSNVGKSSLINMLTGRTKLAKVSGKPGKTQLINHFIINEEWYLVDLPGYGWAKVSKTEKEKWKKMIDEYLLHRENLFCVFVLIDSRLEPQKIDLEFMNWLGSSGVPFSMIFTKADKLNRTKLASNLAKYNREMKKEWEELPVQFVSSSENGTGRKEIIEYIEQINGSVNN